MTDDPTDPSRLNEAMAQLTALVATGPAVERVTQAVADLVTGWADEPDMSEDVLQARAAELWDSFSRDAAELEAQLSDAEGVDPAAVQRGQRVLAAMNAVVAVFARISR